MSELRKNIQLLKDNYAVTFPPLSSIQVQQASVTLVKAGLPPIPLDYVSFLTETNGLSWNGCILFSLRNEARNKGAFFHPGILQNYGFCQHNALMKKKLLLGYGWETLFIYDFIRKEYQVIDRFTFQPITSYTTFSDYLSDMTAPLQKKALENI